MSASAGLPKIKRPGFANQSFAEELVRGGLDELEAGAFIKPACAGQNAVRP